MPPDMELMLLNMFMWVLIAKLVFCLRPNKKISVFRVTGLKILGRVGTHFFFNYFFFPGKNIFSCILKGISPFKMHKIIYFPENLKKNSRFYQ